MSNIRGLPIENDVARVSKFELLRFVAAIMILLWHYQHFYIFESDGTFKLESQLFYDHLNLAFNYGYLGVQLFWMLSGLIFGLVYSDKIFNRQIKLRDFGSKGSLDFTRCI